MDIQKKIRIRSGRAEISGYPEESRFNEDKQIIYATDKKR